jgi:hypothetical protein
LFETWKLATGDAAEIKKLTRFFGVWVQKDGDGFSHSLASAVIDAQGRLVKCFYGNTWKPEEVLEELGGEVPDALGPELHAEVEPGAAREVDHHPRQGFVERHVGVAITAHAALVADGLGERLADGDPDILHGVVSIDVEVSARRNVEIKSAVSGHLVEHVIRDYEVDGLVGEYGARDISPSDMDHFPQTMYN